MNLRKATGLLVPLLFIFPFLADAQNKFESKLIKRGTWKGDSIEYECGGMTLKMKAISDTTRLKQDIRKFGGTLRDFPAIVSTSRIVEFPESLDVFIVIQQVKKLPYIERAEPNILLRQQ